MSLFRRKNKESEPLIESLNEVNPATHQFAGNVAISGSIDKINPSWESESQRIQALRTAHKSFLESALEKGVSESDLPQLVVDAMNNGALPKAVQEFFQNRNGTLKLWLFTGEVTTEAIAVVTEVNHATGKLDTGAIYRDLGFQNTQSLLTEQVVLHLDPSEATDPAVLARTDTILTPIAPQ